MIFNSKFEYPAEIKTIAEIPGMLKIEQRYCSKDSILQDDWDKREYLFNKRDGESIVSVTTVCLSFKSEHKEWNEMRQKCNYKSVVDMPYEYIPCRGRSFSIENVTYSKQNVLRILVYYNPKMDSTVIDAEINGMRTMITNRNDLLVNNIKTISGTGVLLKNTKFYTAMI